MTLRELRLQAGKSAVEAAKELSVTVSAYAHYEQGVRRLNIEQIRPLAKLYEVGIDMFDLEKLTELEIKIYSEVKG